MKLNILTEGNKNKLRYQMKAKDYQKYNQREHIYKITDAYVGSDEKVKREENVLDLGEMKMKKKIIDIPEAVERIYLEILSNSGDNVERSTREGVDAGKIEVNMDKHKISIKNGGIPIPIEKNKEGIYVPEMIFGQLLTSSNYENNKERTGCGRNGYGAKLTNIFSTEFSIDIADNNNGLRYRQSWTNNMSNRGTPQIDKYDGKSYVYIVYKMDFKRFGYESYPEEAYELFARHLADISFTCKVPTLFNSKPLNAQNIKDYAELYLDNKIKNSIVYYQWPNGTDTVKKGNILIAKNKRTIPLIEACVVDTPNNSINVSFANGMYTRDGGIHVEKAFKAFSKKALEIVNGTNKKNQKRKNKIIKLKVSDFKKHVSLFVSVHVINAKYNAQTKTKLASVDSRRPIKFNIDDKLLESMSKWGMIDQLYADLEAKQFQLISKSDGKKKRNINITKAEDANKAGGPESHKCVMWIVEGKSAMSYPIKLLSFYGDKARDYIAMYPMKGKPLNVMNAKAQQIAENQEIIDLKDMLGLRENVNYLDESNFKTLRYGSVCVMADSDVDGKHILGLIINLFHCRYPSLLKRGYLTYLRTPTHRITKGKKTLKFYSQHQYDTWVSQNNPKGWTVSYYKGLGTSTDEDIADDFKNIKYVRSIYDEKAPNTLDLVFNKKYSNKRKDWIANWIPDYNVELMNDQPISMFFNHEFIQFSIDDLCRSLPKFSDGLKISQRKVIWGSMKRWKSNVGKNKAPQIKVAQLASAVSDLTKYHHGEKCISDTIINMTQDFVGSNNLPFFKQMAQFGTRNKGGKDAADARYAFVKPAWWWPLIFVKEDEFLYDYVIDEGESCEPYNFYPILPLQLINGALGIGTGHSTYIPNHNPLDIANWLLYKLKDKNPIPILPWYRGFTGEIKIGIRKPKNTKISNDNTDNNTNNDNINDEILNDESNDDSNNGTDENTNNKNESDDYTEQDHFGNLIEEYKNKKLSLITKGIFEVKGNIRKKVIVSELPIGKFTHDYYKQLVIMRQNKEITSFNNYSKHNTVHFEINGMKNPSYKKLHLIKSYGLSNLVMLDSNNRPIKFPTVQSILETFYNFRLPFYQKRKDHMLSSIQKDIDNMEIRSRFIHSVVTNVLIINNRKKIDIYPEMDKLGFPHDLLKTVNAGSFTFDEYDSLKSKIQLKLQEKEKLHKLTIKSMWIHDIENFIKSYCKHYKCNNNISSLKLNIQN